MGEEESKVIVSLQRWQSEKATVSLTYHSGWEYLPWTSQKDTADKHKTQGHLLKQNIVHYSELSDRFKTVSFIKDKEVLV